MRSYLILFGLFFYSTVLSAQTDLTTLGVLEFNFPSLQEYKKSATKDLLPVRLRAEYERDFNYVRSAESYVAQALLQDGRFTVVDRSELNLIFNELELQKNEKFLDGYVVDQGKSIGAEYLFKGTYYAEQRQLQLALYSVGQGNVVGSENIPFSRNLLGIEKFSGEVKETTLRMLTKAFPRRIPLVKILKGKEVLLAGGNSQNLRRRNKYEVVTVELLEVDGKKMEREVPVGELEVLEVENDNFSRCQLTKGAGAILDLLKGGHQVFIDEHKK